MEGEPASARVGPRRPASTRVGPRLTAHPGPWTLDLAALAKPGAAPGLARARPASSRRRPAPHLRLLGDINMVLASARARPASARVARKRGLNMGPRPAQVAYMLHTSARARPASARVGPRLA